MELVAYACITIRHCANDLVILNKVLLHIVSETVNAVCKKFVFYNLRGVAFKVLGKLFLRLLCEGMFCANNVKFIFITSVVIVNITILFNLLLLNVRC